MSRILIAFVLVAIAIPRATQSQIVPAGTSEIAATSRGEVRVTADHAVLVVSVESRGPSAASVASEIATKAASTLAALRAAGVAAEQITTVGYSVGQDYEFYGGVRRPNGFVARNGLRVDVRKNADVGKLIDAALAAGATQVDPVQFLPANAADARERALLLAVAGARRDAEAMAKAAGGSLGRLIYLSSSSSPQPYYEAQVVQDIGGIARTTSGSAPTVFSPGDITVNAVASGRWEFLPSLNPGR